MTDASTVSQHRVEWEAARYHRTRGPSGKFDFDEGMVEVSLDEFGFATSTGVFNDNYGRHTIRQGLYLAVLDHVLTFTRDGLTFLPDFEPGRHLDEGRIRWFPSLDGWRGRVAHGEYRLIPFSEGVNLVAFHNGEHFAVIELLREPIDRCQAKWEMLTASIVNLPWLYVRWKGRLRPLRASNHAGELAFCRIGDETIVLVPHTPPTDDRPAAVAVELVDAKGNVKHLAIRPLDGADVVWSDQEIVEDGAAPREEPRERWRHRRPPHARDADPHVSRATRPRRPRGIEPPIRRSYERCLDAMAEYVIDGKEVREAIKLRRAFRGIFLKLGERGVQLRGRGGTLKRKMEEVSGVKVPFGPRAFSGAIRIFHEFSPLVRGESSHERVLPFDELHNPDSELSRWLLSEFPDEEEEARPDEEAPSSEHADRQERGEDAPGASSPESSRPTDDAPGPSPRPGVDPTAAGYYAAHHQREAREAQGREADAADPMQETFMTGFRPTFSEPLGDPRGPPQEKN